MGKQKGNNNGGQNNGKSNQGNVGASAARSEQGRERIRKQAVLLDVRRNNERQDGSFYLRVNANRSNDIVAACAGTVGSYAYPGGNLPSMHFNVQKEVGKQGSLAVIRLESIQEGHPLNGAIFSDSIYLPCFYIEKFGAGFASRLEDRISAATQELICHHFCDVMKAPLDNDLPQETVVPEAGENMIDALNGVPGYYRYSSDAGSVVLEVFVTKYPVIRVEQSTLDWVQASRIFLPIHILLVKDQLSCGEGVPEWVFQQQLAIFEIMKDAVTDYKAAMKADMVVKTPPAVKSEMKVLGAKELAKAEMKRVKKIAQATSAADKVTALSSIRKVAIMPLAAFNGKLGFVEMSNLSGELIVHFGMIGNDRVVIVEHIGESHMLRIAGVNVKTKVFAGQVLNGLIDRIDAENLRMTQEDVKRGNALIGYIRDYFASNGIKMKQRKAPDLKKVA